MGCIHPIQLPWRANRHNTEVGWKATHQPTDSSIEKYSNSLNLRLGYRPPSGTTSLATAFGARICSLVKQVWTSSSKRTRQTPETYKI